MYLRLLQKSSAFLLLLAIIHPCFTIMAQEYSYVKLPLFADKENVIVKDIERDAKGFIWFLTNVNIYRYDGHKSLNLASSLPEGISLDDIPQLIYIDNENRLWISGINSLSYFDIDTWTLHKIPTTKLPPVEVREVRWITQVPNGLVFVAYSSGHLFVFDKGTVWLDDTIYQKGIELETHIQIPSCTVWNQQLWVGTNKGALYTISLNNPHQTHYNQLPIQGKIVHLFSQRNQLVLDVLDDGIYTYNTEELIKQNHLPTEHLMRQGVRENEHFIAHIIDGAVSLIDKKTQEVIATMPETGSTEIADIFDIHLSGNEILMATVEGVFVFYPQTQGISTLIPNSNNKSVRALYKFPDGSIFYAGYGGSKYIDAAGNAVKIPLNETAYCILPIDESRLLLGTEGTFLQIFDKRNLQFHDVAYKISNRYKKELLLNPPTYIKSLAEDATHYYIGSTTGLWTLNKKTKIFMPCRETKATSLGQSLLVFHISVDGDKLLLSTHIGLLQYNKSKGTWQKLYPKESSTGVYQHLPIKDTIWLATQNNGVVGIDKKGKILKTINTTHGLSDNLVYSLAIANGYKVAGTYKGLNIIKGKRIKKPNTKSDITQVEFNHGASFYDPDTRQLYMGGLNGYTILDMNTPWFENKKDETPSMITEISITDSRGAVTSTNYTFPYNPINTITLSPQQDILQIYVGTGKNYRNKERLLYKLGAENDNWQEIPDGLPISLTGLSPDSYQLFIGTEREIVENIPITLLIVKEPTFFQSFYFQLLLFIILTFVLWLWFEKKKQKLKKEQELRTKISADLHDDVGSLLTGISMQAEFLQISKKELPQDTYLKSIADSCRDALRAMDDIVWSIDARNDNWKSLVIKLREYAYHLFEPTGIHFTLEESGDYPQKFTQQQRHSIYLVIKEALNNCCKHAKATRVAVVFHFSPQSTTIQISDDGKGFDNTTQSSGQGIQNMKTRINRINGDFTMTSTSKGTTISIVKNYSKNYLVH